MEKFVAEKFVKFNKTLDISKTSATVFRKPQTANRKPQTANRKPVASFRLRSSCCPRLRSLSGQTTHTVPNRLLLHFFNGNFLDHEVQSGNRDLDRQDVARKWRPLDLKPMRQKVIMKEEKRL
ncbi:MAG: hypothetical protein LBI87_14910 [Candidatus Accumulibacter sp.]|nr:hypothetical protein [Accumulibacter sp.]